MRVVRGDGRGPRDAVLVVVLLHDRGHRPCRPDAVAPHDERLLLPVLVEERRAEPHRVERPQLEDVAELDRRLLEKLAVALRTRVAGICLPDVGEDRVVVASGLHTAQMPAVPVCARHELPIPQRLVRDNVDCYPDRSEGAPACAEDRSDLLVRHGPVGLA